MNKDLESKMLMREEKISLELIESFTGLNRDVVKRELNIQFDDIEPEDFRLKVSMFAQNLLLTMQ